ncbi:cupin domain-containing protein [Amphritea pacifica]|uniref:Cupin domain-containing protein n=1 Tax=Amphritea pacifica TaxID=2811233 RepID=A0ABS2WCL3_9GAMM|nr:cupin domain-containing protein [Amphritea pacifica]MBN0989459.1 cupin domain-containing protein [Amphritea pacifica]MBN1008844.1 cupin domain-containing protein [Amphritea pacifica]
MQNLLTNIPAQLPGELFTTLLENNHLKIERIVSRGHHSPENYWYDQDQHEWILLIQGTAQIGYPDSQSRTLHCGDYLHIPAHRRHRVEWTSPNEDTIWLAIHYG